MMSDGLTHEPLLKNISALLENARKKVVVAVNQTMVLTYFEIGRMIVEDEQHGESRAGYGKAVLKDLSLHLTEKFGKGFSASNLQQMKQFYLSYSISQTLSVNSENNNDKLNHTLSGEFQTIKNQSNNQQVLPSNFNLSWSHYLKLMRIKDPKERSFYEIESYKNNWSLKRFKLRQYNISE